MKYESVAKGNILTMFAKYLIMISIYKFMQHTFTVISKRSSHQFLHCWILLWQVALLYSGTFIYTVEGWTDLGVDGITRISATQRDISMGTAQGAMEIVVSTPGVAPSKGTSGWSNWKCDRSAVTATLLRHGVFGQRMGRWETWWYPLCDVVEQTSVLSQRNTTFAVSQ